MEGSKDNFYGEKRGNKHGAVPERVQETVNAIQVFRDSLIVSLFRE